VKLVGESERAFKFNSDKSERRCYAMIDALERASSSSRCPSWNGKKQLKGGKYEDREGRERNEEAGFNDGPALEPANLR
jgi:hypothetical protein